MLGAYGIATAAIAALNFWAKQDAKPNHVDAFGMSMVLGASYGVTSVAVAAYGWPDTIAWFPIIDMFIAFAVYRNWRRSPRQWKLIVMYALGFQTLCHVVALTALHYDALNGERMYAYAVILNVAYIVQLLATGSVGIGHALGRLRRAWRVRHNRHAVADARL